jgi:glutamate-1-semialdehyde aminotransferase
MVTGFRIHPGGVQAWFGIEADIATYGKIVGGGMQLELLLEKLSTWMQLMVVCGIMAIHLTQAKTTFFAGTFCKHPLAMAAARAVLKYLKNTGARPSTAS